MSYVIVKKNQTPNTENKQQAPEYSFCGEAFPAFGKKEHNPPKAHWSASPKNKKRVSFEKAAEVVPAAEEMYRQLESLEGSVMTLVSQNKELHESCIESLLAQKKLTIEVNEMKFNATEREEEIDQLRIENEQLLQMIFRWQEWYAVQEKLQAQLDTYEQ